MLVVVRRPRVWASLNTPTSRNQTEENNSASPAQFCSADPIASLQGVEATEHTRAVVFKELSRGLCRAGGWVTGEKNMCVGLLQQGVSSPAFRGLYSFLGTAPQKQG